MRASAVYRTQSGRDCVTDGARDGDRPIRLGVSSCLLGNAVRYDGGHRRDAFVTDLLGSFGGNDTGQAGTSAIGDAAGGFEF